MCYDCHSRSDRRWVHTYRFSNVTPESITFQQDDFIKEIFSKRNNKMDAISERNAEIKEKIRQMKDVIIQNLINSNKALQNNVKNLQENNQEVV